jgi:hypothetical protein
VEEADCGDSDIFQLTADSLQFSAAGEAAFFAGRGEIIWIVCDD